MESVHSFNRIRRLPPYVFNIIGDLRTQMVADGVEVFDYSMGSPNNDVSPKVIEALKEATAFPNANRYSSSRGIPKLRETICDWYKRRYQVDLDLETEALVSMGSKDGLSHLALATMGPGDVALVPNPSYPIHTYGFIIAGADVRHVPMLPLSNFLVELEKAIHESWPKPKMMVLNFPSNPTTECVDLKFFKQVVDLAKAHNVYIVHDLAYADMVFDGKPAPSILQVPGAKEIAVETYSLSTSFNMAGWRVGFVCGNSELIAALRRVKSYLDYGIFNPIQHAAITALTECDDFSAELCQRYKERSELLCKGLNSIGWRVSRPAATMFVWAKIPTAFRHLGSLEFSRRLLVEAGVAVAPGIGFGEYGNHYVRFALVEGRERIEQTIKAIERFFNAS